MRSADEIKEDLNIVVVQSAPEDYQLAAGLRLLDDVVDYLLDIRDSLRSSRLRDIIEVATPPTALELLNKSDLL